MSFADLVDDMDKMLMSSLNDGQGDYLSSDGAVLAAGLDIILDKEVERLDEVRGLIDRMATITVRRSLLRPFDRRGAFRLDPATWRADGKTWHIDGIAADDGHLITFYVVP